MFLRIIGVDPESKWLRASVMKGNYNGYDCANRSDYCGDCCCPCSVLRAPRNASLFKAGSLVTALGFIGAALSFLAKPFFSEENSFLVIAALRNILTDLRFAFCIKRLELFFLIEHGQTQRLRRKVSSEG
jgi:hypothetical protein